MYVAPEKPQHLSILPVYHDTLNAAVSFSPPQRPNGLLTSYTVEWRDASGRTKVLTGFTIDEADTIATM